MSFSRQNDLVYIFQKKGSDSEDDFDEDDFENSFTSSPPKREGTSRRAAATKVNYINKTQRSSWFFLFGNQNRMKY